MDAILARTNEMIVGVLENWDQVDTVTFLRFGADRFDPSFFVSYDVYYHGDLPSPAEREVAFPQASAFESTVDGGKDRFLVDDVPVRIEYKSIADVDNLILRARDPGRGGIRGTTYGLYRLVSAEPLVTRSAWLTVIRRSLNDLPSAFWKRRLEVLRAQMEHAFSDLTSAAYAAEDLFYQLALAHFLEASCSLIFALNERFDPPGRLMRDALKALARLPEEFESRLQHLLRSDGSMPVTRKREIAQLIAKSLLRMS